MLQAPILNPQQKIAFLHSAGLATRPDETTGPVASNVITNVNASPFSSSRQGNSLSSRGVTGSNNSQPKVAVHENRGILPLPLNRTQPNLGNLAPRPGQVRYGNVNRPTSAPQNTGLLPRPPVGSSPSSCILPAPSFPATTPSTMGPQTFPTTTAAVTTVPAWMVKRRPSLPLASPDKISCGLAVNAPAFIEVARLDKLVNGPELQLLEIEETLTKKLQELHIAKIQNYRAQKELAQAKEVNEARAKALIRAQAAALAAIQRLQGLEHKKIDLIDTITNAGDRLQKAQHDWLHTAVGKDSKF